MRAIRLVPVLALAAGTFACRGMSARPTKDRQPQQSDFDRCYQAAKQFNHALQGQMTIKMYVEPDGAVAFAFVNDAPGVDSTQLDRCITDFAVITKYPGEGLDYLRPYGKLTFPREGTTVMMPDRNDIPKEPTDQKLAQETLEFADWADATDHGWGYYYVGKYAESIQSFREALAKSPDDTRTLRGLASAIAASGGDLKEAKELAAKAIQLKPDSEATHEAMLRVCIAAKDDECIFDSFEKARKAPDVNVRSIELATMQENAKAAAERLQSGEHQKHEEEAAKARQQAEEQMKKQDPLGCHAKPDGDEKTLCTVQTCFQAGASAYADSLKGLTGQDYKAGQWKIGEGKGGASKVTVSIRAAEGQPHDAHWEVKLGDNNSVSMKPLDIDANNITRDHNACGKK